MSVIERGEVVSGCEQERREKALAWLSGQQTNVEQNDWKWCLEQTGGEWGKRIQRALMAGFLAGHRSRDEEVARYEELMQRDLAELREKDAEIDKLQANIAELKEKLNAALGDINTAYQEMRRMQDARALLNAREVEVAAKDAEIAALQSDIQLMSAIVLGLRAEIEALREAIRWHDHHERGVPMSQAAKDARRRALEEKP